VALGYGSYLDYKYKVKRAEQLSILDLGATALELPHIRKGNVPVGYYIVVQDTKGLELMPPMDISSKPTQAPR
jgi:hypothetical protein